MSFAETLEQVRQFDINNIDSAKIGIWPWPIKAFVCLLLIAVVLIGTYYFVVSDKHMQLDLVRAKETTLKETYKEKSFEAANLEAYKEQMQQMKATFDTLLSRLPKDTEVPTLIDELDKRGSESGLTIVEIKLQDELAAEHYVELPIGIVVEGGYHDFGGFVSGVAAMPRIVTLHDYSIERKKDSTEIVMKILAKTYRYKEQEN